MNGPNSGDGYLSLIGGYGMSQSLALSGELLVAGCPYDDSASSGINGDRNDNSLNDSGAAYVLTLDCGDCDLNGVLDAVEISSEPNLDVVTEHPSLVCGPDGTLDRCRLGYSDCNANGIDDYYDIHCAQPAERRPDSDGNGTPDECEGHVIWHGEQALDPLAIPVQANIGCYYFAGSLAQPIPTRIPLSSPVTTDQTGRFLLPAEYFLNTPYPGELPGEPRRGIYAEVQGLDDTGLATGPSPVVAVNYPDWDPLYPLHRINSRIDNTIRVPLPVLFQPGVFGQINGDSDDQIRAFLAADAGFDGTLTYRAVKTLKKLPSFLFFGMPSASSAGCAWLGSDGVPWGYINCPWAIDDEVVSLNASRLRDRITGSANPLGIRSVVEGLRARPNTPC